MSQPEHLQARSLTIVDHTGKPKILMHGGNDRIGASIVMTSSDGKTLQLQEQPDGTITIGIDGPSCSGEVTLTCRGLTVRDKDCMLGVTVGRVLNPDRKCQITIFENGQPTYTF